MMKDITKRGVMLFVMALMGQILIRAHEQEGVYVEPGEKIATEELENDETFWDGIWYNADKKDDSAAKVFAPVIYDIGYNRHGGYYIGDLVIPSETYGVWGLLDQTFTVVGISDMYKNGLTSLYLPETIERIYDTIESCRYLERVHLNNSLKVLNGVKDCPVLTDCPLPLSLEEIGDGWMSGIAISSVELPGSLRLIGRGCFCRLPNLTEITLPETLESMGAGCFSDCSALERITLPSTPILSEGSFCGCPAVKEVSVYAQTPYAFPERCMAETDKANCTLYVPEGCEEAYANAEGWREFGLIVPTLETGIEAVEGDHGEWRAFAGYGGRLVIDSTNGREIRVHSVSGRHVATVNAKGRNEISLPKGVYVVSTHGKAVKVRI